MKVRRLTDQALDLRDLPSIPDPLPRDLDSGLVERVHRLVGEVVRRSEVVDKVADRSERPTPSVCRAKASRAGEGLIRLKKIEMMGRR